MIRKTAAALSFLIILSNSAAGQSSNCGTTEAGFDGFLKSMRQQAAALGISAQALSALDQVHYDPSILKRDRAQGVFSQPFVEFARRMANERRIRDGQMLIGKHRRTFDAITKQYGVPAPVIVAFWALETDFGANIGNLPILQSLATLAWDCRRPEKFRPQLLAALSLLSKGDLTLDEMRGAWAGEIGQTQFLPLEYDETAVDFDGDGRRDLVRSIPDAMASSARLLLKHGWKPNQPWLEEVRVPTNLDWSQADIAIQHPRKQWAKWGIKPLSTGTFKPDNMPASLLLPMGRNGPAFLAYDNFTTAYLKWNESLVYSTTAAYLATRIAGAPPLYAGTGPIPSLTMNQIKTMQQLLVNKGYDVGNIDGKLGKATRQAVKAMQVKMGLAADSYPTPEFLTRLGN